MKKIEIEYLPNQLIDWALKNDQHVEGQIIGALQVCEILFHTFFPGKEYRRYGGYSSTVGYAAVPGLEKSVCITTQYSDSNGNKSKHEVAFVTWRLSVESDNDDSMRIVEIIKKNNLTSSSEQILAENRKFFSDIEAKKAKEANKFFQTLMFVLLLVIAIAWMISP